MTKTIPIPIKVRALGPADIDAFYAFRLEALETSPHSFGTHAEQWRAARMEQVLAMLEDSASDSDGLILGAFQAASLVGTLGFRRESKKNVQHKATLWGFFVEPDARRRGTGRALVREAMARAALMAGLHHVRLIVTMVDTHARLLFEAEGFERYGLEPAGIRTSEGDLLDQAYLIRVL